MKKSELQSDLAKARKSLGLNGKSQQDLLRKVREAYGISNDELAVALGVALPTLLAYLSPEVATKHRRMPEADKLTLARVLADRKSKT